MQKKGKKGEKKMQAVAKPIKATEINFTSQKDIDTFAKIIQDPAKPSQFVKDIFKAYQDKKWSK